MGESPIPVKRSKRPQQTMKSGTKKWQNSEHRLKLPCAALLGYGQGSALAHAGWLKLLSFQSANLGLSMVELDPFIADLLCARDQGRPGL